MEAVAYISLQPSYKKDNGTWVLHLDEVTFPKGFTLVEQSIINIPAGQFGGNHKHPRIELFIACSKDLYLLWQDADGNIHEEAMYDADVIKLWIMPPYIPHTVANRSAADAILYEFANAKQKDVEIVALV